MSELNSTKSLSQAGLSNIANGHSENVGHLGGYGGGSVEQGCVLTSRFEHLRQLGQGGMGTAHLVKDKWLDETVVLKQIRADYLGDQGDQEMTKLFLREASMAKRLSHPNIVQTYDLHFFRLRIMRDVGNQRESYLEVPSYSITMAYIAGCNLEEFLKEECQSHCSGSCRGNCLLPLDTIKLVALSICDALNYARLQEIVHRDLKPSNIFCRRSSDGKLTDILLADFGLARKISTQDDTISNVQRGTVIYMPPEQIVRSEVFGLPYDHRIDLFSLGVILYRLLTGIHPYLPSDYRRTYPDASICLYDRFNQLLHDPSNEELRPRSIRGIRESLGWNGDQQQISSHIEEVVMRCLELHPDHRPNNAEELRNLLTQDWSEKQYKDKQLMEHYLRDAWSDLEVGKLSEAKHKIQQAKDISDDLSLSMRDIEQIYGAMQTAQSHLTTKIEDLQHQRDMLEHQLAELNQEIQSQIERNQLLGMQVSHIKQAEAEKDRLLQKQGRERELIALNLLHIQKLDAEKAERVRELEQLNLQLDAEKAEQVRELEQLNLQLDAEKAERVRELEQLNLQLDAEKAERVRELEQLNLQFAKEKKRQHSEIESLSSQLLNLNIGRGYRLISGKMWLLLSLVLAVSAGASFWAGLTYKYPSTADRKIDRRHIIEPKQKPQITPPIPATVGESDVRSEPATVERAKPESTGVPAPVQKTDPKPQPKPEKKPESKLEPEYWSHPDYSDL
jgi:serine/threonine protein kinase